MPHIHEKIDFVVTVLVVHEDRVLLRMHDKYGIWLGPGGHIEPEEDPCEAAIREVKEEVGLDIALAGSLPAFEHSQPNSRELLAPRFLNRHRIDDVHEHIALYYFATSNTDQVVAGGHDRSEEMKWFTAQELDDPKYGIADEIRFYAHAALNELGKAV